MNNFKKKYKIRISLILLLVFLFSSISSSVIADNSIRDKNSIIFNEKIKDLALEKIDSKVMGSLAKEEYVGVLIYLNDRLEPSEVAIKAKNTLSGLTPYESKMLVRREVVYALQDKAEKSQINILKYLDYEESNGNVKSYKPFYITNMIYVEGNKEVIEKIAYFDEVDTILLDEIIEIEEDVFFQDNNVLNNDALEWNIEMINADNVWDIGINGEGVVIGVIDTGADWTHEAIKTRWRGYNPNDPNNPNPVGNWFDAMNGQDMPHEQTNQPRGTHVLGTILGEDPDKENLIGVAPGAKWIAAAANLSGYSRTEWLVSACEFMLAPDNNPDLAPDIVFSPYVTYSSFGTWHHDIVKAWYAADILPVFPAGNTPPESPSKPGSLSVPAGYPESFSVGSIYADYSRSSTSNQGPGRYGSYIKPEVVAPGQGIRSSVPYGYDPEGYSGIWSGTPMAAAHVVGTAALVLSTNLSMGVDELKESIINTALPLTDGQYPESPNYGYGYGLLNAYEAVLTSTDKIGTIKGQVLVDGMDEFDPTISHNQIITNAFSYQDINIEAVIQDDISIVRAKLLVKSNKNPYWVEVPMERTKGNHKVGTYEGKIPNDLVIEDGLIYKIEAEDYGGNVVFTDDYSIDIQLGTIPEQYETDFESYPTGWLLNGDWEWGEVIEGPEPYNGNKLVGTNLSGKYSNLSNSWLITPPIDLRDSSLQNVTLRVSNWYHLEMYGEDNIYDSGQIYITRNNGETWEKVNKEVSGRSNGWRELAIDLRKYVGSKDTIRVGFRLTSDQTVTYLGWYIDNVRLVAIDNDAPNPPTNIRPKVKPIGVALKWDESIDGDIEEYRIYRSLVEIGKPKELIYVGSSGTREYLDFTVDRTKKYSYCITAVDYFGNEGEFSHKVEVDMSSINVGYLVDFNEDNGNWTSGGSTNSWEWGRPTSGPGSALVGTNLWATMLNGPYKSTSMCYLDSPGIFISNGQVGIPYLYVNHWYETEEIEDKCYIRISRDDGKTWDNILPSPGYYSGFRREWVEDRISLENYVGETIKIRFYFSVNFYNNYSGWYIDNVSVVYENEGFVENLNVDKENIFDNISNADLNKSSKVETKEDLFLENMDNSSPGIPVDAVVTVLETGRTVKTSIINGKFFMIHQSNMENEEWTLRAEAYGYYPKEEKIYLEDFGIVSKIFRLEALSKGTIKGRIQDRFSNEPVKNAKVVVLNDPKVNSVYSDEYGNFVIPYIYEGDYTLKITSKDYYGETLELSVIGNQESEVTVPLERFIGYRNEITYDDGAPETAGVMRNFNSGFGVKFTPSEYGKVVGANIYFWDESFPTPGGNAIEIAIFDTDEYGYRGDMINEPKRFNVNRGGWNYLDLSDFNFSTNKDFFVTSIQHKIGDRMPAIGFDLNGIPKGRTYIYDEEDFILLDSSQGNVMIRVIMEHDNQIPILNLPELTYTNKATTEVSGSTNRDALIRIYNNDIVTSEVDSIDKEFRTFINLTEGKNEIYATTIFDSRETEPSDKIIVIKDTVAPILNITSPEDNISINKDVVHIYGNVTDEYLDKLVINDEIAEIDYNGVFSHRVILEEGMNNITISAIDLSSNITVVERNIFVNFELPVITEITPEEDLVLYEGDILEVSFRSKPNGNGYFRILQPTSPNAGNTLGIPMEEVDTGYYKVYWVVPKGLQIADAYIEIKFEDESGNIVSEVAAGRLTITFRGDSALPMEDLPSNSVILDNIAYDINYLNTNGDAQFKLINHLNLNKVIYVKLNQKTIVDSNGNLMSIDVLSDRIIYYDEDGKISIFQK